MLTAGVSREIVGSRGWLAGVLMCGNLDDAASSINDYTHTYPCSWIYVFPLLNKVKVPILFLLYLFYF